MSTDILLLPYFFILLSLFFSLPPPASVTSSLLPPLPHLPPLPPPLIFVDQRLAVVYPIIQKFRTIITSDPFNITKTWVGVDVCKYKGFFCDHPPDNKTAVALASVDFNGFQLAAPTLDGFLDSLPDIALFHANSNFFSGSVPAKIATLPYLYELDISNNLFSGPFPAAILAMKSLSFLDIRFNLFAGPVPPQLFAEETLDALFLNNNNFMQMLPENLGNGRLLYLTLANNKFFGPIPHSVAKTLSSLTEVLFLNNMLSGCLPYELGLLKKAVVLDAGNNQLTGQIPFSLGCLENVEVLNFAGNMFYGAVPEVVCLLPNLANLSLSNNYFTHLGPICRSLIFKGVIDVRNNCIPNVPFQRPLTECVHFFAQPRYCPYAATFFYIPCWLHHSSSPPLVLPEPLPQTGFSPFGLPAPAPLPS